MTYNRLKKVYLWLADRWDKRPGYWTERKLRATVTRLKRIEDQLRTRKAGNYDLL